MQISLNCTTRIDLQLLMDQAEYPFKAFKRMIPIFDIVETLMEENN